MGFATVSAGRAGRQVLKEFITWDANVHRWRDAGGRFVKAPDVLERDLIRWSQNVVSDDVYRPNVKRRILFESVQDVERGLEAIDVKNDEYMAYDSEGRLLQLSVERGTSFDTIILSSSEIQPRHTLELKRVLRGFFTRVGADKEWLSNATLEELVAEGIKNYKTV
jgi:hypothetical protein